MFTAVDVFVWLVVALVVEPAMFELPLALAFAPPPSAADVNDVLPSVMVLVAPPDSAFATVLVLLVLVAPDDTPIDPPVANEPPRPAPLTVDVFVCVALAVELELVGVVVVLAFAVVPPALVPVKPPLPISTAPVEPAVTPPAAVVAVPHDPAIAAADARESTAAKIALRFTEYTPSTL